MIKSLRHILNINNFRGRSDIQRRSKRQLELKKRMTNTFWISGLKSRFPSYENSFIACIKNITSSVRVHCIFFITAVEWEGRGLGDFKNFEFISSGLSLQWNHECLVRENNLTIEMSSGHYFLKGKTGSICPFFVPRARSPPKSTLVSGNMKHPSLSISSLCFNHNLFILKKCIFPA